MNTRKLILLLFIFFTSTIAFADDTNKTAYRNRGVVIGKLIAEDKTPLSYVSVLLKGTRYGCVTDEDGMFRLEVPVDSYTRLYRQ